MIDDIPFAQFRQWLKEPEKFLAAMNRRVEQYPDDPSAYFARHQAWVHLGCSDLALADLATSLALEEHATTHNAHGNLLRLMGRYGEAIEAYHRAEQMAPEEWKNGFGPLFRADCQAALGDEAAALVDCAALPDDHWTPGMFGTPAGTKAEVASELRRRAAARAGGNSDAS